MLHAYMGSDAGSVHVVSVRMRVQHNEHVLMTSPLHLRRTSLRQHRATAMPPSRLTCSRPVSSTSSSSLSRSPSGAAMLAAASSASSAPSCCSWACTCSSMQIKRLNAGSAAAAAAAPAAQPLLLLAPRQHLHHSPAAASHIRSTTNIPLQAPPAHLLLRMLASGGSVLPLTCLLLLCPGGLVCPVCHVSGRGC